MIRRRSSLVAMVGFGVVAGPGAIAQQRRPVDAPLAVGLESVLVDDGYADVMRRGFASATGLQVRCERGHSSTLLQRLEQAEIDAAITQAPALEDHLEAQGLTHDRHEIARTDFLLVGPPARAREIGEAARRHDAAAAMASLAHAEAPFVSRNDGSGTHLLEQSLWRAASVAPQPAWYHSLPSAGKPLLAEAAAQSACTLVDRSTWLAASGAGLRVLIEGDARLASSFHVQRPFRGRHPAAKLFVAWLSGPNGLVLATRVRGLRRA